MGTNQKGKTHIRAFSPASVKHMEVEQQAITGKSEIRVDAFDKATGGQNTTMTWPRATL